MTAFVVSEGYDHHKTSFRKGVFHEIRHYGFFDTGAKEKETAVLYVLSGVLENRSRLCQHRLRVSDGGVRKNEQTLGNLRQF